MDFTKSPWTVTPLENEKPVTLVLDSGADVTVAPYDSFLKWDVQADKAATYR